MKHKLTPFEKQLKEGLEQVSFPYDSSQWTRLEGQLNAAASGASISWWMSVVAGVATMGLFAVSSQLEKQNASLNANTPIVASNQIAIETNTYEKANSSEPLDHSTQEAQQESSVEAREPVIINIDPITHAPIAQPSLDQNSEETQNTEPVAETVDKDTVTSRSSDIIEINLPKTTVCVGEEVKLSIDKNTLGVELSIDIDGEKSNLASTKSIQFDVAGVHSVSIYNKRNEKIWSENILVSEPDVDFTVAMGDKIRPETEVIIIGENPQNSYSIFFDDSQSDFSSYLFKNRGNHLVRVVAEDPNGCRAERQQNVFVDSDYNLLAPNAFSPNGDGMNDTWTPLALSLYDHSSLIITNREGQPVFTSSDSKGWNGRLPNGEMAKPGQVYSWKCKVNYRGDDEIYMGRITIVGQ